jgi:Ricin-type beta-trefoil lectin domain
MGHGIVRTARIAVAVAGLVCGGAHAGEVIVDLRSPGDYRSVTLAAPIVDVDLVDAFNGACRLNRTWGFDPAARTVWVNGGCAARFRVVMHDAPPPVVVAPPPPVVVAPPAPAVQPTATPPQQVRGLNNLCLDIAGGAKRGHGAQLYNCNRGDNQRFSYTSAGEIRVDGYCLDVQGESYDDGARAVAWRCNGQANQRWRVQGQSIRSEMNGKCLTVQDGRGAALTPVVLWSCSGRQNQRWRW